MFGNGVGVTDVPVLGGGSSVVYPMDSIATAPAFAASTRKLSKNYSGPCLRVRRASDNAEQDIGFASNGTIDAAALDSFGSGTTLYVKTWYDQSGNARHATQATAADQPIIDNRSVRGTRAVTFGRTFNGMAVPAFNLTMTNRTVLMVGGAEQRQATGYLTYDTNAFVIGGYGDAYVGYAGDYGPYDTPVKNQRQFQGIELFGARWNASVKKFRGGQDQTAANVSSGTYSVPIYIGGNPTLNVICNGMMPAYIIYDSALSDSDLAALQTATNTAFGTSLSQNKLVGFFGDSIAHGTPTSQQQNPGYAAACRADFPKNVTCWEAGVGSSSTSDFPSHYSINKTNAETLFDIVVHQHGTNDIGLLGDTPANIQTRIQSNCGLVRADGKKVIVCTMTPANHGSTPDRDTVNTWIRTNWASFADGLCDLAADPVIGAAGAQNNTALYPDALHPSPYCVTLMGKLYRDAIAALA